MKKLLLFGVLIFFVNSSSTVTVWEQMLLDLEQIHTQKQAAERVRQADREKDLSVKERTVSRRSPFTLAAWLRFVALELSMRSAKL